MAETRRKATPNLTVESCRAALLLIDVINRFDFEGGDALLRSARPMSLKIAALRARAVDVGMPVIYVNDNFGRWRSDFRSIVRRALADDAPGRAVVKRLAPSKSDYFVLKPSNSAFYGSVLETLLRHLHADTLVLAGVATDNCVLFTAHDAYLRGFRLFVPRDCVAAESRLRNSRALELMSRSTKADIGPSAGLRLEDLVNDRR